MSSAIHAKTEPPHSPADVRRAALQELIELYETALSLGVRGYRADHATRRRQPHSIEWKEDGYHAQDRARGVMEALIGKVESETERLCKAGFPFPAHWRIAYAAEAVLDRAEYSWVHFPGMDLPGLSKAIREMKVALWQPDGAESGAAETPKLTRNPAFDALLRRADKLLPSAPDFAAKYREWISDARGWTVRACKSAEGKTQEEELSESGRQLAEAWDGIARTPDLQGAVAYLWQLASETIGPKTKAPDISASRNIFELKPSYHGIGVDLRALWSLMRKRGGSLWARIRRHDTWKAQ